MKNEKLITYALERILDTAFPPILMPKGMRKGYQEFRQSTKGKAGEVRQLDPKVKLSSEHSKILRDDAERYNQAKLSEQ